MKLEDYEDFTQAFDFVASYIPNITPQELQIGKYTMKTYLKFSESTIKQEINPILISLDIKYEINPFFIQPYYRSFALVNNRIISAPDYSEIMSPNIPLLIVKDLLGNDDYNYLFIETRN